MKKTVRKIIVFILAAVSAFFAVSCNNTPDPYKDYVVTEITPKTKVLEYFDGFTTLAGTDKTIKTYKAYLESGADLGYTQAFFEKNNLFVSFRSSSSSDHLHCDEVVAEGNLLYLVLVRNKLEDGAPVNDDYVCFVFYAETAKTSSYEYGGTKDKYI